MKYKIYCFNGVNLMENIYRVGYYNYESCLQSQFLVDPLPKKPGCVFFYSLQVLFPHFFFQTCIHYGSVNQIQTFYVASK